MGRIAMAVASVVLALVGVELGLRAIGWSHRLATSSNVWARWIVYDPILVRRNEPGYVDEKLGIRVNALGLRGDEIATPKPPGTIRVVCLGDSTTFGVFKNEPGDIRASSAYPAAMAEQARDRGLSRVEVVNAGTLGATSTSGLALFLAVLRRLEPDVLVVRLGNNDHTLIRGEPPPLSTEAEYVALKALPAWALRSEVVRLAFHGYRRWLATRPWALAGHHATLERYEQNIRRLVAEAHAIGTRILFLDFPYRAIERGLSPGESFPNFFDDVQSLEELHAVHATYEAATVRIARDTGDEYLRTEDAIRAAPFPVFTDYDLSHLNDDGARLLGALVLNRLQELGWLGATTSATRSPATAAAPAAVPAAGSSGR
jgi:lysophospholipase L1-like esterase